MKSRRVHRARVSRRQASGVVETYRLSSRGLNRVFQSILPAGDPQAATAAARGSHHLAEVEALLPRLREAIRSCRYPGAEHGDPAELIWGLWSHLSETSLHIRGALQSLEVLGQRYRYREEPAERPPARAKKRKGAAKGPNRKKGGERRPRRR
jgi:hypothetical protein